jgi:hypothetical protein
MPAAPPRRRESDLTSLVPFQNQASGSTSHYTLQEASSYDLGPLLRVGLSGDIDEAAAIDSMSLISVDSATSSRRSSTSEQYDVLPTITTRALANGEIGYEF